MEWELWRQDYHGNEFLVRTFDDAASAAAARDELLARGHHQHYWVQPVQHGSGRERETGTSG